MNAEPEDEDRHLLDVEKSQAALRESIEQSKRLTEKSQSLLDQHRKAPGPPSR